MPQADLADYFSLLEYKARARVNRTFKRLTAEQRANFADVPATFVADARTGKRGTLPHFIKPLNEASRFAGSAVTVAVGMHDLFAPVAALDLLQEGDVLVIAAGSADDWALFGGHMAMLAHQRGAVAIVTDGLVRDSHDISRLLPCFCKGATPSTRFSESCGEVGLPISVGGVQILSGDLLLGDRDGVVHVPSEEVDGLAQKLALIRKIEKSIDDDLSSRRIKTFMNEFPNYESKIEIVSGGL